MATAREDPAPFSLHREMAGPNIGPDLGAGFHPLLTLPSVPQESLRSGSNSWCSSILLPLHHGAIDSVEGQLRGAGWIPTCLGMLVYLEVTL